MANELRETSTPKGKVLGGPRRDWLSQVTACNLRTSTSLPLETQVHAAYFETVPRPRSEYCVSFEHIYRNLLPFLLLEEALRDCCSKRRTAAPSFWLSG